MEPTLDAWITGCVQGIVVEDELHIGSEPRQSTFHTPVRLGAMAALEVRELHDNYVRRPALGVAACGAERRPCGLVGHAYLSLRRRPCRDREPSDTGDQPTACRNNPFRCRGVQLGIFFVSCGSGALRPSGGVPALQWPLPGQCRFGGDDLDAAQFGPN